LSVREIEESIREVDDSSNRNYIMPLNSSNMESAQAFENDVAVINKYELSEDTSSENLVELVQKDKKSKKEKKDKKDKKSK
jgi:hypothetical protein